MKCELGTRGNGKARRAAIAEAAGSSDHLLARCNGAECRGVGGGVSLRESCHKILAGEEAVRVGVEARDQSVHDRN